MADWTTIADATLEPGKPWRSIDALAVRDNPIAISEGASGAPKVRTAALQPPASGTGNLIFRLQNQEVSTTSAAYQGIELHNRLDSTEHLGVNVLVPGVITCYAEHRAPAGGNVWIRVVKNGVQVQEWTTTSATFVVRQVDVTVATGDQVLFQQRTDLQANWRNLRIYSANIDMAVC